MAKIFKVEAEGDVVYVDATDLADAKKQFKQKIGDIPSSLLTFSQVDSLPEDEVFI